MAAKPGWAFLALGLSGCMSWSGYRPHAQPIRDNPDKVYAAAVRVFMRRGIELTMRDKDARAVQTDWNTFKDDELKGAQLSFKVLVSPGRLEIVTACRIASATYVGFTQVGQKVKPCPDDERPRGVASYERGLAKDILNEAGGGGALTATDPDLDRPRPGQLQRPSALALAIGVESYRGDLPPATGASRDAALFADYAEQVLGISRSNIHVLRDSEATRSSILAELEEWLPRNSSLASEIFVFFAGHGTPDPGKREAYLLPWDAQPQFVTRQGIALAELQKKLGALPAKIVYTFLDACFSGAGGRSVIAAGTRPIFVETHRRRKAAPSAESRKIITFTATGPNQVTGVAPSGHGLFSYFLLLGLNGRADVNGDGAVSLAELVQFTREQVANEARRQGRDQQPELDGPPVKDIALTKRTSGGGRASAAEGLE